VTIYVEILIHMIYRHNTHIHTHII